MILLFFLLIASFASSHEPGARAVTYEFSDGRMGNHLFSYLHGKWVADHFGYSLLYKPFEHSDQFLFHEQETLLFRDWHKSFKKKLVVYKLGKMSRLPPSTLIIIPYFRDEGPKAEKRLDEFFEVGWHTQEFRLWARNLLKPRFPIQTIQPPRDTLNVLVHVRAGGGFDSRKVQLQFFYKFPPKSFYINSLEKISEHFGHPPLYAYVMTDDPSPTTIVQELQAALPHLPNIRFDCRENGNVYKNNAIEDFFSIPAFDCLIRGDSTFSIVASLLTDFKMIICPEEAHVEGREVIIDKVKITTGA